MSQTESFVIDVNNLSNRFGSFIVHENLDLQVRQGEIIGVVGGSGSGKSVLMRSILALNKPSRGKISVLGCNALSTNMKERQYIEQ
nr:ATP-binding cassette domain-containing protein [Arenimonas sp.]